MARDEGWGRRFMSNVVRAVISQVADAAGIQLLQVRLNATDTRDATPRMQEFGFTANPPLGGIAIVMFAGGDRSSGVVIGTEDPRYRPTGLAAGESMQYSQIGQRIYLAEGGIVVEAKGLPVTVQNATIVTVQASGKIIADTPLFECTGDIIDNTASGNKATMADMRTDHNSHAHVVQGIQTGNQQVTSETPTVLDE